MNTIIYDDIEYQLTDTEKEIYENQHLYDIDTILKLPMYRNLCRNNKIIECRDDYVTKQNTKLDTLFNKG